MMPLTETQVINEIVAIKVCDTVTSATRGEGVAFWCNVSGVCKLVTAAHLAWPVPMVKPQNEVLHVHWATTTNSGSGVALFTPHTPSAYPDYAEFAFLNLAASPPSNLIFPCGLMPNYNAQVACIGFPGSFRVPPSGAHTSGIVSIVQPGSLSTEALVNGNARGGYSGGPIFDVLPNGALSDHVVGLMSGAPPLPGATPDANGHVLHNPNQWIFFGAVSFK